MTNEIARRIRVLLDEMQIQLNALQLIIDREEIDAFGVIRGKMEKVKKEIVTLESSLIKLTKTSSEYVSVKLYNEKPRLTLVKPTWRNSLFAGDHKYGL